MAKIPPRPDNRTNIGSRSHQIRTKSKTSRVHPCPRPQMHLSRMQSPSEAISTRPHSTLARRSNQPRQPAPVMRASPQLEDAWQLASHSRPRLRRNHLDQPTRPHRKSTTPLHTHARTHTRTDARGKRRTTTVLGHTNANYLATRIPNFVAAAEPSPVVKVTRTSYFAPFLSPVMV